MGWTFFNSNGEALIQNAESEATQAEMEAETAVAKFVPPDLVKNSPGVAKAWCKVTGSDGALETGSHGVSSTSRSSTGVYKIYWDPDFSGTNYVVMTSQLNVDTDHIAVQDSRDATYALLEHVNSSGTASDKNMMCVAFGEVV